MSRSKLVSTLALACAAYLAGARAGFAQGHASGRLAGTADTVRATILAARGDR